jgi:hypothetical protein
MTASILMHAVAVGLLIGSHIVVAALCALPRDENPHGRKLAGGIGLVAFIGAITLQMLA